MSQAALIELFHGKGAHVDPAACIEDLSAEAAARTIPGFPHSTWQLLSHMNYWMDYETRRIDGGSPHYPQHASESWPAAAAPPSDAAWKAELARFRSLVERQTQIAQSDPDVLSREIPRAHEQQTGKSSTVGALLWQTLVHNSYHTGQIAMIRRCIGLWPPAGGGDSW
jgi:uncharacterized damage-inducible protein DinB